MALTYHQRTFDLIGVTPRISSQALFWLDRVEHEQGIQLPGAVRELYSVVCASELIRQHIPVFIIPLFSSLNGLGVMFQRALHPDTAQLVVMYDDFKSERFFFVPLQQGDNPPVYVSWWQFEAPLMRTTFETFSDLIYLYAWDFRQTRLTGWHTQQHAPLTPQQLDQVQDKLTPYTVTTIPGLETTHRFVYRDARVVLIRGGERETYPWDQHEWWVYADTVETFREVVLLLESILGVQFRVNEPRPGSRTRDWA